MTWNNIEVKIVKKTEAFLTWRKRRKLKKKEKQKRKNQILDWVQALLWAACVVLVINQYFIQAYAIPTGSMEDTIIGDDRIFVDKFSFGPELVPGAIKLPGPAIPQRGEIIVFVNPEYYNDMGRQIPPVEELINRLLYMLSFTFINLDKTPDGEIAHHFLVKRLIGIPEDQLRMREGRVEIKGKYESEWVKEEQIQKDRINRDYQLQKKIFPFDKYDIIKKHAIMQTELTYGIPVDQQLADIDEQYARLLAAATLSPEDSIDRVSDSEVDSRYKWLTLKLDKNPDVDRWPKEMIDVEYKKLMLRNNPANTLNLVDISDEKLDLEYKKFILEKNLVPVSLITTMTPEEVEEAYKTAPVKYLFTRFGFRDEYFEDFWEFHTQYQMMPYKWLARKKYTMRELGWYIPEDRFFPMGDNRDNSRDARYFNAVKTDQALGRSMFRFWPIPRIGGIE